MAGLELDKCMSKIEKDVEERIRTMRASGARGRGLEGPLFAALEQALRNNREIRSLLGRGGNQMDTLVAGVLTRLERQMALDEGQTWCDSCTSWHPLKPHNPAAI